LKVFCEEEVVVRAEHFEDTPLSGNEEEVSEDGILLGKVLLSFDGFEALRLSDNDELLL
jgi:hypothetical protein